MTFCLFCLSGNQQLNLSCYPNGLNAFNLFVSKVLKFLATMAWSKKQKRLFKPQNLIQSLTMRTRKQQTMKSKRMTKTWWWDQELCRRTGRLVWRQTGKQTETGEVSVCRKHWLGARVRPEKTRRRRLWWSGSIQASIRRFLLILKIR